MPVINSLGYHHEYKYEHNAVKLTKMLSYQCKKTDHDRSGEKDKATYDRWLQRH